MGEALPGIWTAAIAIVSGAGGAALLELWWKPWRAQKNVAVVLAAEIVTNAHLIAAHFVIRKKSPLKIGDDFRMSTIGFHAVANQIPELEANIVGRTLLLYSRFDVLNQVVVRYSEGLSRYEEMRDDDTRRAQTESYLNAVIDVFNTGADAAFRDAKELLPALKKIGRIRDQPDPEKPPDDFQKRVEQHLHDRQQRLAALKRLQKRQGARA